MRAASRPAVRGTTILLVVAGVLSILVAVLVLNLQVPPGSRALSPLSRPALDTSKPATPKMGPTQWCETGRTETRDTTRSSGPVGCTTGGKDKHGYSG